MGQAGALGVASIVEQGTGCRDGARQVAAAEAVEVLDAELIAQQAQGSLVIEVPIALAGQARARGQAGGEGTAFADHDFGRRQTLDLGQQLVITIDLEHAEATGGELESGQAPGLSITVQRHQQVVAAGIQQRLIMQRSRGDDTYHLALDRPLAGRRVTDLLTDGHRFAHLDQACQIAFGAVVGHPCHGNR